jgi:hypothetical protein
MNAIPQPSEPLFTVHLNRQQGELVLIALNVFERLLMQNLPQMHDRIQEAARFYSVDSLPDFHTLGHVSDLVYDPLYEQFFMSSFDHLVNSDFDPETGSDEEFERLVADIQQKYGRIELPEVQP